MSYYSLFWNRFHSDRPLSGSAGRTGERPVLAGSSLSVRIGADSPACDRSFSDIPLACRQTFKPALADGEPI